MLALIGIAGCATPDGTTSENSESKVQTAEADPRPQIITGNGKRNFIILEGASRRGATFSFPKVQIERNGWLVMHPFKDGKPVPTVYVGSRLVKSGLSENVEISVGDVPETGTMFVVMLHFDMNDDGVFDFNDGITVPDAPVFEDGTLVALRYATPEETVRK